MRALRIGLLMHSVNPRGGVIHTLELARALHDLGHDVTVMAVAHPSQQLFRAVPHRFEIVPIESTAHDLDSMVTSRIDAYVRHLSAGERAASFDVLHAQDGIGANALANLVDRGQIAGYAATVHHIDHWPSAAVNALQRRAIRRASVLFCVSELWQQHLQRDYASSATLVCNGVDLARFNSTPRAGDIGAVTRLGLRPGAPLIVSIGGIEPRKNTRRLLHAFELLRESHPTAQWAVVGGASLLDHSAYQADFHHELARSGLRVGPGGDVVLTGVLPDADLPALMRLADVVAFPSIHEGFGLVVIEALACGAPVVVSRIKPFTDYLRGGEVVWTEPDDPLSIASALAQAASNPRCRTVPPVCRAFSWTHSAQRHLQQYRRWLRDIAITLGRVAMPAMYYTIRWPDQSESECYSPSLIIREYFGVGQRYPLPDFLERLRTATGIASERVRARYGYACSRAHDQLLIIEEHAARFSGNGSPSIEMVSFNGGA